MLLEIAIGDALGACFEWTEKWIIQSKNKLEYLSLAENPSVIRPGNYTDDTQMTLAIAELMVEGIEWTPYNIANKFVECYHRDPRRGYAPGFLIFLENTKTADDFLDNIRPNSERSGAAMRAGPLGLISSLRELKEKCDIQSNVTHNTRNGRDSAFCAALMVHYFKYNLGPKNQLLDWLNQYFSTEIDLEELKKYTHIPVEGWPCVKAAIDAILRSNSLSEVLVNCIEFAGDTDTICTIAMGPASFSAEILKDIPKNLVDGLENETYGRDYIVQLDQKLNDSKINTR